MNVGCTRFFLVKVFFDGCIAATIVVEILFAAKQAKRLERKACVPPYCSINFFFKKYATVYFGSINFFSKNTLQYIIVSLYIE